MTGFKEPLIVMNERVVPKITNFCVVKLSNSPAITQHREVPVPRRQDVDERPCVPRLELNGPALRHFESQPDSPRINQRFLNSFLTGMPVQVSCDCRIKLKTIQG